MVLNGCTSWPGGFGNLWLSITKAKIIEKCVLASKLEWEERLSGPGEEEAADKGDVEDVNGGVEAVRRDLLRHRIAWDECGSAPAPLPG
jgi:hypothetical protein